MPRLARIRRISVTSREVRLHSDSAAMVKPRNAVISGRANAFGFKELCKIAFASV